MFEIDNQFKVNTSLPVIVDNYTLLHFDEYPILFSGTNKYGNKLLGSLSSEEDDLFRYFVIILDDKQYSDFINKRKSYLDLITQIQEIFVVDRDINENQLSTYQLPLGEIPKEYLPLSSSYIPEYGVSTVLNFAFSLKGKLADYHKALVNEVNGISQRIYNYLEESFEALDGLDFEPKIYLQPSAIGSYRINFDIEIQQPQQYKLFQLNEEKVGEFINAYLNYVAYTLPSEDDDFLNQTPEQSKNFLSVKNSLIEVYQSANVQPAKTISDKLVESINNSAAKLSEVTDFLKTSQSFKTIELGSYVDNEFKTIGYLDNDYKSSVALKLLNEYAVEEENQIESDEEPKDYRILVFRLNRDTGNGGARLYYHDEDFNTVKLYIHKMGKELSNSTFTKSLDEDKVVDVKGIATKINGVYKKIDCYL